jgi:hypothetical protein
MQVASNVASLAPARTLLSFSTSPAMNMEMACSTETAVGTQRTTWRYIPGDSTVHSHESDNLKPCKLGSYEYLTMQTAKIFL